MGMFLDETQLKVVLYESSLCMLVICGCYLVCFELEIIQMQCRDDGH